MAEGYHFMRWELHMLICRRPADSRLVNPDGRGDLGARQRREVAHPMPEKRLLPGDQVFGDAPDRFPSLAEVG